MRRHPDTGLRTGDFVLRWPGTYGGDVVYRIDGVRLGGLTLVACCARGTDTISDWLDLDRATEEDIPTDAREAAILALECGQLSDAGMLGEDAYVACCSTLDEAKIDSSRSDLDAGLGGFLAICLHAAALLRDGWNPGDPVEVLP